MQIKKNGRLQALRNGSLSAFFYFRLTIKAIFCISKAIEQNHKELLLILCNLSINPKEMGRV